MSYNLRECKVQNSQFVQYRLEYNISSSEIDENGECRVYSANKIIGKCDQFNYENAVVITGCRGSCGQIKVTKPKSFVTHNSFIFNFSEEQKYFYYCQLMKRGLSEFIEGTAQPQITLESIS